MEPTVSERIQPLQEALQSYDDRDLEAAIVRLAQSAHDQQETVERLIVDLKHAVDSLPANALRARSRRDLRDCIVRLAITAYYESAEPEASRFSPRERHSSF